MVTSIDSGVTRRHVFYQLLILGGSAGTRGRGEGGRGGREGYTQTDSVGWILYAGRPV